jgi:hypothetical protein
MKPVKIELKSVHINHTFSEETLMFKADIYVDGVKAGYAENHGHGGNTNYDYYGDRGTPVGDRNKKLIETAEAYAKSLPAEHVTEIGGQPVEPFDIQPTLEHMIDRLVEEHDIAKHKERTQKQLQKRMQSNIVFGKPGGEEYRYIGWTGRTLVDIAALPNGKKAIEDLIARVKTTKMQKGDVILNDNLKALGINI